MPALRRGQTALSFALVIFTGCSDLARRVDGSLGVVEVIETAPPISVEPTPQPQPVAITDLERTLLISEPQLVVALPPPARHTVTVTTLPANARLLSEVQSVEVDVEVQGGALGVREIAATFVSPQGLVWERQVGTITMSDGQLQRAHFSLPVASTFIEEQQLSGAWRIDTHDEGVALAASTVMLEGVVP